MFTSKPNWTKISLILLVSAAISQTLYCQNAKKKNNNSQINWLND